MTLGSATVPTLSVRRVSARLDDLRTELAELACGLEQRRQLVAADVANTLSARLAEVQREFAAPVPGFDGPPEGGAP